MIRELYQKSISVKVLTCKIHIRDESLRIISIEIGIFLNFKTLAIK